MNIGCHLSSSKGFLAMGMQATSIGANTFQFFARNPRGGSAKDFNLSDALALNDYLLQNNFAPILAHAPYTTNPSASNEGLRQFAIDVMQDDLIRISHIQNAMYNFHPGCHTGQGTEKGIEHIAYALNQIVTSETGPIVLLETMAGKGTEIGGCFDELAQIISKTTFNQRIGVCLDTCHVFDAGYNIKDNLQSVLDEFDKTIGLYKLKAIHLNDSLHGYACHKDRHAKIGQGHLGVDAFAQIINHPSLKHLPFYLETPNDLAGYAQEIALLKSL